MEAWTLKHTREKPPTLRSGYALNKKESFTVADRIGKEGSGETRRTADRSVEMP
jgi:hypothetical protein